MTQDTRWWRREEDVIVCELCPRGCRIKEGKRGFCFIRKNEGGQMTLTAYGKSTGFCIDPIEKKPLNHFLPGTPVLSFGTSGCNLGCKFCQNWDISKSKEIQKMSQEALPEDIVHAAKKSNCRSLAFTYNDPTTWAEYVIDTAKIARQEGIKTIAVTAAYINPQSRKELYQNIDAANIDLKAFSDLFYRRLTRSEIAPVLDTIQWMKNETNVWFELTTLLIPKENDSAEEIKQMCDWILSHIGDEVPIHFTAFHPDYKMMKTPKTPHSTLVMAREIALNLGIKYAYIGNCLDVERQSTYCPSCKKVLIERDHYELGAYHILEGRCAFCHTSIPGVFEDKRGSWGRKREPLRVVGGNDQNTVFLEASKKIEEAKRRQMEQKHKEFLTESESQKILAFARSVVSSSITGKEQTFILDKALFEKEIYGVFISLKREGILRGCTGVFDHPTGLTLGQYIQYAAENTAKNDTRFPSLTSFELNFCTLEVSIMHSPEYCQNEGVARLEEVELGIHGLLLTHPRARGLLLPQVPVEQSWDKLTFLSQLCRKAGSSLDLWKDRNCQLMKFQCHIYHDAPLKNEICINKLAPHLSDLINAVPDKLVDCPVVFKQKFFGLFGVLLVSFSGEIVLQFSEEGTILELLEKALSKFKTSDLNLHQLFLLTQPILLHPEDSKQRLQSLYHSLITIKSEKGIDFIIPSNASVFDRIDRLLDNVGISRKEWQEEKSSLMAFHCQGIEKKNVFNRSSVFSGSFYPGQENLLQNELKTHFKNVVSSANTTKVRAVMLPHAGWRFCGDVMAKTLKGLEVPDEVIIIGPKHTHLGANFSIASHESWEFPGFSVPIDREGVEDLVSCIQGLECEADAHLKEHGIEVQVPFFYYKNPNLKLIPVVLGQSSFDSLKIFSKGLRAYLDKKEKPPLLVISSDMNHFACDSENRRLDKFALDAMESGCPHKLFNLCREKEISMCGLLPAVLVMLTLLEESSHLQPQLIDYDTSARVSGDESRVVGYAGVWLK